MSGVHDVDSSDELVEERYRRAALNCLVNLEQTGGIDKYIDSFELLRLLVDKPFQNEEVLMALFLMGLHPSIKTAVKLQKPVSLDDCYSQARWIYGLKELEDQREEYQRMEYQRMDNRPCQCRFGCASRGDDVLPKSYGVHYQDNMYLKTMTTRSNKSSSRKSSSGRSNGCFSCGELGHFKRDCPQLMNARVARQ